MSAVTFSRIALPALALSSGFQLGLTIDHAREGDVDDAIGRGLMATGAAMSAASFSVHGGAGMALTGAALLTSLTGLVIKLRD